MAFGANVCAYVIVLGPFGRTSLGQGGLGSGLVLGSVSPGSGGVWEQRLGVDIDVDNEVSLGWTHVTRQACGCD